MENNHSSKNDFNIELLDKDFLTIKTLTRNIVFSLETLEYRLYAVDLVVKLGVIAKPFLEELFRITEDAEVKTFTALCLLHVGSDEGLSWLQNAVLNDKINICTIVLHLYKADMLEKSLDVIIERLTQTTLHDIQEVEVAICITNILTKSHISLPSEVRDVYIARVIDKLSCSKSEDFSIIANLFALLANLKGKIPPTIETQLSSSEALKNLISKLNIGSSS